MFRLFECCALSFFERFVLSFSLKIERFVSDSAEIWICGLYTKELHLQLSDEDLAQFELDAKETERLGHIGTHMDCYMEAPRYKEYVTDAVVVDCRNGLPADEYFNNLDIEGKALVLYTGNMATNDYATKDFFMFDMKLNWDSLAALLYNHPKFILIDSHGLGMFSQHRLFDMECEKNGCFLIMCLMLEGEEILNIKKLKIEIDKEMPSTGKPCRVYGF